MSANALKKEADDHLRDIRRRKGVDDSNGQQSDNVEDLNRALDILSDQLYKKPTHFLLELIQNADDNTFESDVPTICITLDTTKKPSTKYLRVDCNEVGFDKANVEALCRIGASTKKSKERTKGYIGEKGIGFKSIFKVGDIVHISSRGYAFKFDRRGMLGMIVPIIEAFPLEHLKVGQTQTLLEIKGKAEFEDIRTELEKLEPQILIFLRKLCKLVIYTPVLGERQFGIRRLNKDGDFDGKETAIVTSKPSRGNRNPDHRYVIVRRTETSLEKDDRRENITETETVLAFPIDDKMRPILSDQHTYAYLPIDNYGFNYLIQGDFLLVANRESVDSSAWNNSVLEGVFRTFLWRAVPRFNEIHGSSPSLRYTWPLFLKDRRATDEFWSKLKRWLFIRLATEDILECRHNMDLSRPDSLFYIPSEFRSEGEPLVEDEETESHHLSFAYDPEMNQILPELKKMSVKVMSFLDFYTELRAIISRRGISFLKEKSNHWHSKVADLFRRKGRVLQLEDIPLIPLRDGRWVTTHQSHVFLEEDTSLAAVPSGLDINLVDAEACRDASRKAFFRWLDIKPCDQAAVCRLIMQRYKLFRELSLTHSIQDLIYLFQTPRTVYKRSLEEFQLLPAPPLHGFKYAKKYYVEYPGKPSIVSKYARDSASNIPLLHPDYLDAVRKLGEESEFLDWACSRLKMSTQPRLVDDSQNLTREFKFLEANATIELLLLLRDHWDTYDVQLNHALITAVSGMLVDCTDGVYRRLDETALPRENLKVEGPNLPFIAIPEPNETRWLKFSLFGVLANLSYTFYLRQLKALTSRPDSGTTSKLSVQAAYTGLECYTERFQKEAQDEFIRHPLVFIEKLKRWVFLRDCVWSGPHLDSVYYLSTEFPRCKKLFRDHLRLGNVTLNHVIHELESVTTSTPFSRLEELLLQLNTYLRKESPTDCLSNLKGKDIIPVRMPNGTLCRMNYDSDIWYLADRQKLWYCFDGKLPLITFDVTTVRKLDPLIQAMKVSNFLLSEADEQTPEATGDKIYDEERTLELRRRASHFQRLIKGKTISEIKKLAARLETLQVWGVSAIKLVHKVGEITGAHDTSSVIFDATDESKLDIIYVLNTEEAILNFELSKDFIEFCDITDKNLEQMVPPILAFPINGIEELLESHGLDLPNDPHSDSAENFESVSEQDDENDVENSPISETNSNAISSPRIPSPHSGTPHTPPDSQISGPSSMLRDRIPALDERISSVKAAAAQPDMTPTLVITPSQRMGIHTPLVPTGFSISSELSASANSRRGGGLPPPETDFVGPSTPSPTGRRPQNSYDAFDLADMNSALSNVLITPTPSRNYGSDVTSRARHPHSSRFSQSPRNPRPEPDPEHTMQGLYNQYIGLQGEVFINEWLSQNLKPEWDATNWTSRNRNQMYPDNLFKGREKDFTDFTYQDTSGKMTELLTTHGFIHDVETWSEGQPIYHLEVKSTSGSCDEPFYMSNSQMEKARTYTVSWGSDSIPIDVYVVLRVYDLKKESTPGFTAYVDPWAMCMNRELSFMAQENFMVTPNGPAEIDIPSPRQ